MKKLLTLALFCLSLGAYASFTIGTYNIRNFDYDERARIHTNKSELGKLLTSLKTDVLSVEEINNTAEFERFVAATLPGYDTELSRCGGEHGQKLGFMFNKNTVELISFHEEMSIAEPGTPGGCNSGSRPAAIALFKIRATGQKFFGVTVHLKSGSDSQSLTKRTKQFQIMKDIITNYKAKFGIQDFYIAGDMNTTEYLSRGSDYKLMTTLVSSVGGIDAASNLKCSAYWWGGSDDGIETPSLLDHIVMSPGLNKTRANTVIHGHCQKVSCRESSVKDLGIIYGQVSDHCPMTATVQ